MNHKLYHFEFLRALAIILILITHSTSYLSFKYLKLVISVFNPFFAQMGLAIFIFISGYLIYSNNSDVSLTNNLLAFYKKRVLRIYPLYWLSLITFIVVYSVFQSHLSQKYIVSDSNILFSTNNLIIHGLGLETLLAPSYSTPIFTLYFIGVILICYLLYPVINSRSTARLLSKALLIYTVFLFLFSVYGVIDGSFFEFYLIFVFGLISAKNKMFEKRSNSYSLSLAPLVFALVVILSDRLFLLLDPRVSVAAISSSSGTVGSSTVSSTIYQIAGVFHLNPTLIVFYITVMIFNLFAFFFCAFELSFASHFMSNNINPFSKKLITFLSFSSYPIYLFHRPFFSLCSSLLDFFRLSPIIKDLMIIFFFFPVLCIISFYIQKLDSHLKKYF